MNEWLETIIARKKYFNKVDFAISHEAEEQTAATLKNTDEHIKHAINCPTCEKQLIQVELIENRKVCNNCNHHIKMHCLERIGLIFDEGITEFFDENLVSLNPIDFPEYDEKLEQLMDKFGINEAVITGRADISNNEVYFGIMDYRFIMGSMGSVVGEKLTRMIERATEENKPIIIFTASGGARMQEGMISLYQMAKVVAAIEKHSAKGLLYISVLTDPTTGGVIASFASIADITIAEPNAIIGFAGKRVISNTIKEEIPDNFQTSEFHFENGHIDIICERKNLKKTISDIISLYTGSIPRASKKIQYETIDVDWINNSSNTNISSWERVKLARHIDRPNFQDYIDNVFDNFIELHGDKICSDDMAIVTGIGYINGIAVTVILSAKGKNLEENILRNFGMARPEGYRKVIRITKLAEKFGLPVICFIDTPGAHCGVDAERMGQGEAIASSIRNFTKLTVPIISIIIGEGGSGGALATGVADWIFIMENSIYSVISPEGCASILFKDSDKIEESSEYLKLTSDELLKLNIVDEIIAEPYGGAHLDNESAINYLKIILFNKLIELLKVDREVLLKRRYEKFRKYGMVKDIELFY